MVIAKLPFEIRLSRPLFSLILILCLWPIYASENNTPWVVTYTNTNPISAFNPYRLIILDSVSHPPLTTFLKNEKKITLAYLSLGEIGKHRSYFKAVKEQGILLHENKNWPGSFAVDVRDKRWQFRVLNELIPSIIKQGFHGIFIDTLDIPIHLAQTQTNQYQNMKAATINIIKSIRVRYPDIKIMINRAYPILTEIAPAIDMVLGESVFTTYNFEKRIYQYVSKDDYRQLVLILKSLKSQYPHIQVMTLDYWSENDQKVIAQIYAKQRANGFSPYVATIKLDKIIPEPIL